MASKTIMCSRNSDSDWPVACQGAPGSLSRSNAGGSAVLPGSTAHRRAPATGGPIRRTTAGQLTSVSSIPDALLQRRGQTAEIVALDLAAEPELAAIINHVHAAIPN